jgi:hypothetical protein
MEEDIKYSPKKYKIDPEEDTSKIIKSFKGKIKQLPPATEEDLYKFNKSYLSRAKTTIAIEEFLKEKEQQGLIIKFSSCKTKSSNEEQRLRKNEKERLRKQSEEYKNKLKQLSQTEEFKLKQKERAKRYRLKKKLKQVS